MTAYMVILAEIDDPEQFRHYVTAAAELVAKSGGEYLVRGGGESQCLEGDWPDGMRLVISKWPSMERARAFWHSDDYDKIKKLRHGHARVKIRLIEGVD
ncbi:hypothetical protein MNBD_ALPHA01-1980 [hydrothermal vent metagenome]|uniref:DUF1330 domain-containing protein n=1 Tax=hydrothermal vent metagenome TaxID=652676 RepID=A0A3B0S7T4_9ZZZZ